MATQHTSYFNPLFRWIGDKAIKTVLLGRAKKLEKNSKWMNDGQLHVILPGTGGPLPDPTRAGPCAVVMAGGEYLVIDCGQNSYSRQWHMSLPIENVTAILITHFHSDHICEIGETCTMSWAQGGRSDPLPIYGPPGIVDVVNGFAAAYKADSHYREAHHGYYDPDQWKHTAAVGNPIEIAIPGGAHDSMESTLVMERNGLKVFAFNVDHKPVSPAFGFRFEYNGEQTFPSHSL